MYRDKSLRWFSHAAFQFPLCTAIGVGVGMLFDTFGWNSNEDQQRKDFETSYPMLQLNQNL